MPDIAHERTEKILNDLQDRIVVEYAKAVKDMQKKLSEYFQQYEEKRAELWEMLENGEITKAEYDNWVIRHTMTGKHWETMQGVLAKDLENARDIALKISGEKMPDVYALNANFGVYQIEHDAMIDTVFGGITSFIDEGRTILADEFGKEYGTYFTILAAIASGRTTYSQIVNEVGMDVGGYLTRLETQYALIAKRRPIFEKTGNKSCVYQINDCFFRFWFRFVFGYSDMIELKRLDDLRTIVRRDFSTFAGYALERYFHWKFAAESHYRKIAGWWDRKGENEIDLVCEDARDGRLDFYEVKTDAERLNMGALKKKVEAFFAKNPEERPKLGRVLGISCKDM